MKREICKRGAFIIFALLCQGVASAEPPEAPRTPVIKSRAVHYSKVDLSWPAGVASLYQRIVRAARDVCGYVDIYNFRQSPEFERCYERAVSEAVTQVGSSALAALHRDRMRQVDAEHDTVTNAHLSK